MCQATLSMFKNLIYKQCTVLQRFCKGSRKAWIHLSCSWLHVNCIWNCIGTAIYCTWVFEMYLRCSWVPSDPSCFANIQGATECHMASQSATLCIECAAEFSLRVPHCANLCRDTPQSQLMVIRFLPNISGMAHILQYQQHSRLPRGYNQWREPHRPTNTSSPRQAGKQASRQAGRLAGSHCCIWQILNSAKLMYFPIGNKKLNKPLGKKHRSIKQQTQ